MQEGVCWVREEARVGERVPCPPLKFLRDLLLSEEPGGRAHTPRIRALSAASLGLRGSLWAVLMFMEPHIKGTRM